MQKGACLGPSQKSYEYTGTNVRLGPTRCQRLKEGDTLMETHLISLTLLAVLFGFAWHNQAETKLNRWHKEETNHKQQEQP